MTEETPDRLSTLRAARQCFEGAHHIWYKAMDSCRWKHPITAENVQAAYDTTGPAISLYTRGLSYIDDLIRAEQYPATGESSR